jgi:hypothetical protein
MVTKTNQKTNVVQREIVGCHSREHQCYYLPGCDTPVWQKTYQCTRPNQLLPPSGHTKVKMETAWSLQTIRLHHLISRSTVDLYDNPMHYIQRRSVTKSVLAGLSDLITHFPAITFKVKANKIHNSWVCSNYIKTCNSIHISHSPTLSELSSIYRISPQQQLTYITRVTAYTCIHMCTHILCNRLRLTRRNASCMRRA